MRNGYADQLRRNPDTAIAGGAQTVNAPGMFSDMLPGESLQAYADRHKHRDPSFLGKAIPWAVGALLAYGAGSALAGAGGGAGGGAAAGAGSAAGGSAGAAGAAGGIGAGGVAAGIGGAETLAPVVVTATPIAAGGGGTAAAIGGGAAVGGAAAASNSGSNGNGKSWKDWLRQAQSNMGGSGSSGGGSASVPYWSPQQPAQQTPAPQLGQWMPAQDIGKATQQQMMARLLMRDGNGQYG